MNQIALETFSFAKLLLAVVIIMMLQGCDQLDGPKPNKKQPELPLNPQGAQRSYFLDFDEIMEFHQGQQGIYPIDARVPYPGQPLLSAEGLPEGAEIVGGNLVFKPSCEIRFAEGQFYRHYQSYRIRISLRSDQDPGSLVQKTAVLLVYRHNLRDRSCEEMEQE